MPPRISSPRRDVPGFSLSLPCSCRSLQNHPANPQHLNDLFTHCQIVSSQDHRFDFWRCPAPRLVIARPTVCKDPSLPVHPIPRELTDHESPFLALPFSSRALCDDERNVVVLLA